MNSDNRWDNLKSQFLVWEQEYSHVKWGGPRSIEMVSSIIPPECKILDAGCGNGRHLLPLSKLYNVTGIELSPTALKNAKSYIEKNNRCAHYCVSTTTHLPFYDKSFNGVLCLGVLQHLYENERLLTVSEFSRVLVPGGFLFFEAFGVDDMRYGKGDNTNPEENTFIRNKGIIYHYFTRDEVKLLLEKYRFQISDIRDMKTEKKFKGERYTRHMIHAVAQKV
ncbi:MAG: methyltransferase domain-containing protein [Methanohalobium sp.]|uniref:methyltransferase domain-containing protein n=1 Tax=Methanohalobium sp. TaxID=2837493 RepID=UPI00397C077F